MIERISWYNKVEDCLIDIHHKMTVCELIKQPLKKGLWCKIPGEGCFNALFWIFSHLFSNSWTVSSIELWEYYGSFHQQNKAAAAITTQLE